MAADDELDAHLRLWLAAWPQIDPTVEGIVARITKTSRLIEQAADVNLGAAGLTREEFRVLCALALGTKSHGELCRELGAATGTMTNRLDKLERGGLVVRKRDPNDRRGVLLALTPTAEAQLEDYVNRGARTERALLAGLLPEERDSLLALLRKLHAAITEDLHGAQSDRERVMR